MLCLCLTRLCCQCDSQHSLRRQRKKKRVNETDALKSLIDAIPGRTVAAKLRRIMPDIDRRVREGIQHEEIIVTLNANGFTLNLNTFRSYLYRYRRAVQGDRQPVPAAHTVPDGGLPAPAADPASPADLPPSLDDLFDPIRRDALGEKYLGRTRPLFQKGKSQT